MRETYRVTSSAPAPSSQPAPQGYAAWIGHALRLAEQTRSSGDVPVGAVVLDPGGTVIGQGWNQRELGEADPTAHAEVVALRAAGRHTGSWRLAGCTLAVTLEPCPMCAGALVAARIGRVIFGAWDPKMGACGSVWDIPRDRRVTHHVEVVGGIRADECGEMLQRFFAQRR